jgi:hypothetical protein
MRAQQRLRYWNSVLAQRRSCFEQARVVRRELDVLRVGFVGAARIADRSEVIAECTPCIRHFGLEAHCAPQGRDRALAIAPGAERQPELVVRGGPIRLRLCKRFEDRLRCDRIARAALCHAEQQRCQRVTGRDLQDFRCLFGRELRLRGQQTLRVCERGFERSNRF